MSPLPYYQQGVEAQKAGKEMWECPYVSTVDWVGALPAWLAGWMWAKQQEKSK